MQKSRKVPVRLLVLVYLTSPLDVGGEFAIGVVRIARARELIVIVIVIVSRHCCCTVQVQAVAVLRVIRVRDECVVYLEDIGG